NGILPEILPATALSRANGGLHMARYLAIVLGSGAAGAALALWSGQPARLGLVLIGLAAAGAALSLCIAHAPARDPGRGRADPRDSLMAGLDRLARDEILRPVVAGLTLIDFLGALVMLDVLLMSRETLNLPSDRTGLLAAFVGLGIGFGSFL